MKKHLVFIFSLVLLVSCSSMPEDTNIHKIAGWITAIPNPFEANDTVLAIKVHYQFESDMNGRDYILTLNQQMFSFVEDGKMKDSIIVPMGNLWALDKYIIYNKEVPDTLKVYNSDFKSDSPIYIFDKGEIYLNTLVEIYADGKGKPYTYFKLTEKRKKIYMFEMTLQTDIMPYEVWGGM